MTCPRPDLQSRDGIQSQDKYLTDGFSLGELKSVLDTLMLKFGLHLRRRQYRDDIVIGRQVGRELCHTMKTKQT